MRHQMALMRRGNITLPVVRAEPVEFSDQLHNSRRPHSSPGEWTGVLAELRIGDTRRLPNDAPFTARPERLLSGLLLRRKDPLPREAAACHTARAARALPRPRPKRFAA